jgi:hypothetical protein
MTIQGQSTALGGSVDVNSGAVNHSFAINRGAGQLIDDFLLGAHQIGVGTASSDPIQVTIPSCPAGGLGYNYGSPDTVVCNSIPSGAIGGSQQTFSGTSVTVPGLSTTVITYGCFNSSGVPITPSTGSISGTTPNNVSFTFATSQGAGSYCNITAGGGGDTVAVAGTDIPGDVANFNATTPAIPVSAMPGGILAIPQADTGNPTTNISHYTVGFVPRPASQRRWGGWYENGTTTVGTGFADVPASAVSGGTSLSNSTATSTFPMAADLYLGSATAASYGTIHGQSIWRRNGNALYAETTILATSLTAQRIRFGWTSNAIGTQWASLQPTGDYAELVFDAATSSDWICQSAQAGTKNQVITTTAPAANTIYVLQLYFSGASDSNFTALVNGVSVCGTYTTDLPTATSFLIAYAGIEDVAGGTAANLYIGPVYLEGGSN